MHLAGKGTPLWDPGTRGALLNLALIHTKEDIARALFEGLAVSAKECVDHVAKVNGRAVEMVRVAVGLTNDPFFNQLQADFFQKPVERYLTGQATTLGAWISAYATLGFAHSQEDCVCTLHDNMQKQRYLPSAVNAALYQQIETEIIQYENVERRRTI